VFKVIVHFNDYVYEQKEWINEFTRMQQVSVDAMRVDLREPDYNA
jgi:hypothetical protein